MDETWIDLTVDGRRTRHTLEAARTRFGSAGCDIEVPGIAGDELHVWSDPPKLVAMGGATVALLNGRAVEEAQLADGDSIQWGAAVLVLHRPVNTPPVIEELAAERAPAAGGSVSAPGGSAPRGFGVQPNGGAGPGETRVLARLQAGMLVDLALADRNVTRRWQEAVLRSEFDADACARDLLSASQVAGDDPRLVERAGRLQRDLLMAPYQRGMRGAGRSARKKTRRGLAYVVANLIAIFVYSLLLVAIMLLVRVNYDFSFDGLIDSFLESVTPGE